MGIDDGLTTRRRAARIAIACVTAFLATSATAAAEPIASAAPRRAKTKRAAPRVVPRPIVVPAEALREAEHPDGESLARLWPYDPVGRNLSLSEKITERITQAGNTLGEHLDLLSQDMFKLRVDAGRRRAHIRLGGGDEDDLLVFRFASDLQFSDLNARVDARVDLGVRGHLLHIELPAFQLQAAEYRGDYGMQLEVPLFERHF